MEKTAENKSPVSLADVGKLGTAYVSSSSQALKLASEMLKSHEGRRDAALKKIATIRDLLSKAKLIESGEEKEADTILSDHERTLDTLANVVEAYSKLASESGEAKQSSLGQGVDSVGGVDADNGHVEKRSRMIVHERRPRGGSQADVSLRDALLR